MPRSSRASLSDETIQELESQFYAFLNSLSSNDRKKFFAEFLTNEEKMMMYKRLALYWCLLEGYSLAKIQQMIGVTHDTTRVYNKRKNTLSEEFKELIGRIGKGDMSALEEAKKVENVEEKHAEKMDTPEVKEEPMVDQSVNLSLDAPIETRPIDEPMMDVRDDIEDKIVEKETTDMDKRDEEMEATSEEKKDEFMMDSMPSFDDMHVKDEDKEESGGLMPSEKKETSDDQKDNEGDDGKKKSGIAKFFGF